MTFLCHWTTLTNLETILDLGILSRKSLEEKDIDFEEGESPVVQDAMGEYDVISGTACETLSDVLELAQQKQAILVVSPTVEYTYIENLSEDRRYWEEDAQNSPLPPSEFKSHTPDEIIFEGDVPPAKIEMLVLSNYMAYQQDSQRSEAHWLKEMQQIGKKYKDAGITTIHYCGGL